MDNGSRGIADNNLSRIANLAYFFKQDTIPGRNPGSAVFSDLDCEIDGTSALVIAEKYGLKAQTIEGNWQILCNRHYPSIAKKKDGKYILVLKADNEKFLIHDSGSTRTSIVSTTQFLADWSGQSIIFSNYSQKATEM